MFYFVIFCKVLITNECGTVFGRQGPEVRTEASLRADRRTKCGSKDRVAKPRAHLLTPTSFFLNVNYLHVVYPTTAILCARLCENRVSCNP